MSASATVATKDFRGILARWTSRWQPAMNTGEHSLVTRNGVRFIRRGVIDVVFVRETTHSSFILVLFSASVPSVFFAFFASFTAQQGNGV